MRRARRVCWLIGSSLAVLALLAGCGGGSETEATPTSNTPAAAEQVSPLAAQVSPLAPLAPPESPLTAGPRIEIAVPSDIGVITQLAQETKASPPQAGMASLSGVLYSPKVNRIIPGTQFYLTPAIEEDGQSYIPTMFVGPKEDRGDIAGFTNEKGQLMLDNIPPGNYYLAVWSAYDWLLAFGGATDELPLLLTLEDGAQRDLGLLYVDWP